MYLLILEANNVEFLPHYINKNFKNILKIIKIFRRFNFLKNYGLNLEVNLLKNTSKINFITF